jgi:hypothetical protein
MCRKLLILLMVLGFVGSVQAALVHEWEFDNNVSDTSGSGNHGTVTGTTTYVSPVDDWCGATGKAFGLNEATKIEDLSPVNLPVAMSGSDSLYRGPAFSVNIYVKAASDNTFSSWDGIAGWGDYASGAADRQICSRGTTNAYFHGYTHNISKSCSWTDWDWHMITFTFDQSMTTTFYGNETMWVDGVKVHEATNVHWGDIPDPDIVVGFDDRPSGGAYWKGAVDGFQIWNSALSQDDVDQLMTRIPEPATIALLGLGGLVLLRKKR